jgi:hypothetical protein
VVTVAGIHSSTSGALAGGPPPLTCHTQQDLAKLEKTYGVRQVDGPVDLHVACLPGVRACRSKAVGHDMPGGKPLLCAC